MENIKPVDLSDLNALKEKYLPYFKEIKKRLYITAAIYLAATIAGFVFNEPIIRFLINALSLEGINIVFTSPFQFINLAISCGLVTGVVVIFPLIIFQVLHFLKPALKRKEFAMVTRFIPICLVLFVLGFVFGAVIMKWQIEIFLNKSQVFGIGNILDISGLLSTVFLTSAIMGLGFQFPLVLLLLMRLGLVDSKQLSKKRPWVYLGSFIFTLFLPPDSVLADVVLTLPLIILFESTLFINWLLSRKKKKEK